MRIVRNTEEQLILANTPWLLSICLVAFVLVFAGAGLFRMSEDAFLGLVITLGSLAFGAVFLIAFVRRTQLILDRHTSSVFLRRRGLLGYSEQVFSLDDLSRAEIQVTASANNGTTRRVALKFRSGPNMGTHPVTLVYVSGGGPQRAADTINNWLRNGEDD